MTEKRLFLALDLPAALAAPIHAVAAHARARCAARLEWQPRFVAESRMHMTLKFLGNVDEARVPELGALVRDLAARHAPLPAEGAALDAFPRASRAHVLVLAFEDRTGAFASLSADLEGAAAVLGFARDDRPFRPHVTLARLKHTADLRAATREPITLPPGTFDRVVLYESVLGKDGPTYTPLATATLTA